ncbi:hypothetical protein CAC42_5140 [Sphaceloma murrayae]|uniref:Borealin N-terminal domain-containing protein n=1 Tax=Sphaceloma murrayae TaxID=2082308 RepID=A0A2K1QU91_9PEZI|nr:hypothetical protein CAC42_5140 [Sphaceloma murrayae]
MASTPEHVDVLDVEAGNIAISEARKQMLIDNLQLEITERARKLRAQYAMQAQGLRTRIEMRVNRIPHSLRHANMQELVDKYSQPPVQKVAPPPSSPQKISYPALSATAGNARGVKRSSDSMPKYDKENEHPGGALENPKKRVKTTAPITAVPSKPTRTASRKPGPTAVLSPKSHNSRTFPTSPLKAASPVKESVLPKPTSRAVGPSTTKQVRPASRQIKRPAPATSHGMAALAIPESGLTAHNRPSSGSDDSNGTTIVKKPASRATGAATTATAKKTAAAPVKTSRTAGLKNALSSLTGSKRAAASKKATAVAPTATTTHASSTTTVGGRTLRKRGSPAAPPVPAKISKATPASSAVDSVSATGVLVKSTVHVGASTSQHSQRPPTSGSSDLKPLPPFPSHATKPQETPSGNLGERKASATRKPAPSKNGTRVSSGRIDKTKRQSKVGVKRLGSRRIGKLVEKGKGLFTRSKTKMT